MRLTRTQARLILFRKAGTRFEKKKTSIGEKHGSVKRQEPAVHGEKKHEMRAKCDEHAISAGAALWDTSVSTPETVSMASHMVANAGNEIAVACGVQRKAAAGRRVEHNGALTVV